MNRLITIAILVMSQFINVAAGQQIDILIKNGHVIDPRTNLSAIRDVAITGERISDIAPRIDERNARTVIDASGLYVAPGFIDIHTHVFVGTDQGFADGINSVAPDDFAPRAGVTTVVDAGTAGWRNFPLFKERVIDRSRTRVLAFLSIAGLGLSGKAAQEDLGDMNVDSTVAVQKRFADHIIGIKIGHYEGKEWTPFERAVSAAEKAGTPLLVECHLPQYTLEDQLSRMRPGDIITHSFEKVEERMPVADEAGTVRPFVLAARDRGILFDVGHGGAGFWFSQAIPSMAQGLAPNSFGTDMHRFSVNAGMKDMMNVMSKYMAMGMALPDVIARATWLPAKAIKREDLGHLTEGAIADISIFAVREGRFGFVDAGKNRIEGKRKLEAELTLRAGRVVWDLNGLSASAFPLDEYLKTNRR